MWHQKLDKELSIYPENFSSGKYSMKCDGRGIKISSQKLQMPEKYGIFIQMVYAWRNYLCQV
jgi:hypothetical protein